jgi:hypothetical protein
MSDSAVFFFRGHIPEADLIRLLNKLIPEGVESLDLPNDNTALFLQHVEYSEGFACSASLAWGIDSFELDEVAIAHALAKELSTEVLFQPSNLALPAAREWCLAKPEGRAYAVNVVELDDWIAVQPNSPPLQLLFHTLFH